MLFFRLTQLAFSSYQLFLHLGPYYPVHLIKILRLSACALSTEPSGWALEGRPAKSGTGPETERGWLRTRGSQLHVAPRPAREGEEGTGMGFSHMALTAP